MIFAVINNNSNLFDTWQDFHTATFSPLTVVNFVTDFRISGADYKSRKAAAAELAKDFMLNDCGGLTWGEYNLICNFFVKIGKRYGLMKEYRENGIL